MTDANKTKAGGDSSEVSPKPSSLFVRDATGLTRQISGKDALIYNINTMGILFVFGFTVFGAGVYLGVDLTGTALFAVLLSLPIALLYAYLAATMPRTGGDYVWVSRIIHPGVGFVANFVLSIAIFSFVGSDVPIALQWGLASSFQGLGITYNNASLTNFAKAISSPTVAEVVGLVFVLLIALLMSRGVRPTFKLLWIFYGLIMAGVIAFLIAVVPGSASFSAKFDAISGTTVTHVVNSAVSQGYLASTTVVGTLLGSVYTLLNFTGFSFSAYFGGEVKRASRSQMIAIIGSLFIFGAIIALIFAATYYAFGKEFVGAVSFLYMTGSSSYNLAVPYPFPQFLLPYITSNPILIILPGIGFTATALAAEVTYVLLITRNIFAWSFDRVVPTKLAAVDEKRNSPYMALVVVIVLTLIFQTLWLYTKFFTYIEYTVTGLFIAFAVAGVAGAMLPYVRKDIFATAPALVRQKIGPVPVLTIFGALTLAVSVLVAYATVGIPTYIGPVNYIYLSLLGAAFVIPIVIFAGSWYYHKNKGIPMEMAFKQIPPE